MQRQLSVSITLRRMSSHSNYLPPALYAMKCEHRRNIDEYPELTRGDGLDPAFSSWSDADGMFYNKNL